MGAARLLREQGWDAQHVLEIGLSRARDQQILDRALADNRVCITLDADFHSLLATSGASKPSVLRFRWEGLREPEIVRVLVESWPRIDDELERGALVTLSDRSLRLRRLPIGVQQE